jgi:MOSC domain-containing protein YiiM
VGRVEGRVEEINIGPAGEVPAPVQSAEAHAGKGLVGNRYYFVDGAKAGQALTLIAAEALEGLAAEHGIELTAAESRRNVLTRGIDLNALVGKRFRVGPVECAGVELCEPCTSLEAMTRPGVIKGLLHRGGLNADILTDGVISLGDEVAETA